MTLRKKVLEKTFFRMTKEGQKAACLYTCPPPIKESTKKTFSVKIASLLKKYSDKDDYFLTEKKKFTEFT